MRTLLYMSIAGLLLSGAAMAQQAAPSTPTPSEQDPTAQTSPGQPATIDEPRSIFGESLASRFTVISTGNFQQDYDDNIFSSSLLRVDDYVSRFSGRISATMNRKHGQLELHYLPGYTLYATYSGRNSFSQQGIVTLDQHMTARTSLRFNGLVSDASSASLPAFSLVRQGSQFVPVFNPGGLQVNSRILSSNGDVTLTHLHSARTNSFVRIEGATTGFSDEFGSGVSSAFSQDSFSVGGGVGLNRTLKPGSTLGVELGHRYFGFDQPSSHANYDYAKLRFEQTFARAYTFRLGAGPSFRTFPGRDTNLDYALDASLSRSSRKTLVGLFVNHDSHLSTFQGALGSTTATASLTYRGWKRWNTTGSLSYARNEIIGQSDSLDSYSFSDRIGFDISPSWQVFGAYSYSTQIGKAAVINQTFHRNVASFGISYSLSPTIRY